MADPQHLEVQRWAQAVRGVYDQAQQWLQTTAAPTPAQRATQAAGVVERSHHRGRAEAQAKQHPGQAVAQRRLRHAAERLPFVLVPELEAHPNRAERSSRRVVVIRTLSGGARSTEGTPPRMALASLCETWPVRGLKACAECCKLLSQTAVPQV